MDSNHPVPRQRTPISNRQYQSPTSILDFPHDKERLMDLSVLKCNIAQGIKKWPPTTKDPVDMSLNSVTLEDKKQAPAASAHPQDYSHMHRRQETKPAVLRTLARIIFMDLPLLFILITFASVCWVHYVHDEYLVKQIDAAKWTMQRGDLTDMTYYFRTCDKSDLSTANPLDLYLPDDATPDDVYQHQLKHGFTIFANVLSQETCNSLRQYIVSKNKRLTPDESIWLIEWNNRWSFPLGTEEESVANAVMELASNKRLKQGMAKILGENPATIELTAITSGYGAKAQAFHHDGRTSLGQFGQSVAHAYSIFIQLQNTTKAGGATGVCPGSHYCAEGLEQVCDEYGVYPVNANGHVAAGDAMVMNMDSWHRGSAHTDPNEPDRVMLVVTFTSQPRERAESRLLPQGISYSLRWDLWGHTWNDLETANATMKRPWTILRSLGLYKKPSADYGVDYVSSVSQRMANEYFGFTEEDLETFVDFGGFKFLPPWLQAKVEENTKWHDFLLDTFFLCNNFVKSVTMTLAGVYIVLCTCGGMSSSKDSQTTIAHRFSSTTLRLALMCGTVFALYKAAIQHVDNTPWAMDLRNDLRYTSPFGNSEVSDYDGILTIPHVNDVLIETRYKSRHLGMYNDYIGGHPGNRIWNELVDDKVTLYSSYSGLPSVLRGAISEYIVSAVEDKAGRFLYQTRHGNWAELPHEDAVEITNLELKVKSNPVLTNVIEELHFLLSEAKYGTLRQTVMAKYDIFSSLLALKDLLLGVPEERSFEKGVSIVRPVKRQNAKSPFRQFAAVPPLSKPQTAEKVPSRPVVLHVGELPGEPVPGAWLRQGDLVTVYKQMEGKVPCLFKATLLYPLSSGVCFVNIHALDNKVEQVDCDDLTRYNSPSVGHRVHVKDDETFVAGTIVQDHGGGLYDVKASGKRVFENISDDMFLRVVDGHGRSE